MTRSTMNVAVSADYADALMTARKAKTWLFVLLLLFVLAQLTIFLLARFNVLKLDDPGSGRSAAAVSMTASTNPATAPGDVTDPAAATQPAVTVDATTTPGGGTTVTANTPRGTRSVTFSVPEILRYVISAINFLAILLGVVFCIVTLLLTMIMLVGRLIGVSHVTSAFIWSVFLVLLLFPWQAFLISGPRYLTPSSGGDTVTSAAFTEPAEDQYPAFKIPGVLYTYPELAQDYRFDKRDIRVAVLKWGRYAAMPLVALVLLLTVNGKANRGLRLALGEADIQVEVANRGNDPLV